MDSTALRYFLEVARTGAINSAALSLNVASSAISRQIASLEADVGMPLFERHTRGMRLTEAGELLAAHSRLQELETERVLADIHRLTGQERAIVRIATVEGIAQYVVPEATVRLMRRVPGVRVQMSIPGNPKVTARVRSGEADLGITFALAPEREIRVERRLDGSIYAFVTADHPLAGKDVLSIRDFADGPVFLMEPDTTVRQLFDIACAQEGVAVTPAFVSNNSTAIRHLTLAGVGVSIASLLTMGHLVANGRLVAKRIGHPVMQQRSLQVQSLAGRTLPLVIETFLACLDAVIAEITPA